MLFLLKTLIDKRQRLWSDFRAGKLTDQDLYAKLLELDPNDYVGLVGMAKWRRDQGDLAGAEEHYWQALQENPCGSEPYVDMARMLHSDPASEKLALALSELAILKKSREEDGDEFLKCLDLREVGLQGKALEEFTNLPAPLQGELLTTSMRRDRQDEPASVTERLRLLRLIEEIQQGVLDAETVDAVIAEGPAIVPLLVGVMRAWVQDLLGDDGDSDVENALALLGETGSPNEIPHLLEFVDLDNETAAGAAAWALGRIIERSPDESAKLVESIAAGLGIAARLKVAEQTLRVPAFDPEGKLLDCLSGNLENLQKDDRDRYFPLLLLTMAIGRGRAGVASGRAALRRQGGRLSRPARSECEDLLTSCEELGVPGAPPISSPTVYDICAGEASWDEDDGQDEETEDDFLPQPEPVRRKATPGRNDPCWCNSGKKYKKCHLDSDAGEIGH